MEDIVLRFWQSLAVACISVLATLIGFWAGIGRKIVNKDEIIHMIKNESVYVHDRQFIMERLALNKENHLVLTNMLQRNTEVMNELKIQIATLGKTLEALEDKIERR